MSADAHKREEVNLNYEAEEVKSNLNGGVMDTNQKENKESNPMKSNQKDNKGVETMENNQQTTVTVTARQRKAYEKCLKVFEHSTKSWVDVAEAYITLLELPKELWQSDSVMENEQHPSIGLFLEKKFDLSKGRLSQLSGAYKAWQELKEIEGHENISCNALYEIYRFVNSKFNWKKLTILNVYEAIIHGKGAVYEKTVKEWCSSFKSVNSTKHETNVMTRLQKVYQEAKSNLEDAKDEELEAIKTTCITLLKQIGEIIEARNGNVLASISEEKETNEENGGEERQEDKEHKQVA